MPRYRVSIETYFGRNEGTFNADNANKAKYMMYKYVTPPTTHFKFHDFLRIFAPTAERVDDNALMTWKEYGSIYGYPENLSYIGAMKNEH